MHYFLFFFHIAANLVAIVPQTKTPYANKVYCYNYAEIQKEKPSANWKIGGKIQFEEEGDVDYIGTTEINKLTRETITKLFDVKVDSCAHNAKALLKKENGLIILTHREERSIPGIGEEMHATLLYTSKRVENGHETLHDIYNNLRQVDGSLPQDQTPTLEQVANAYQKIIKPEWKFQISDIQLVSNDAGIFIFAKLEFNNQDEIQNYHGNPISGNFLHMTLAMIDPSMTEEIEKIQVVVSILKDTLPGKTIKIGNKNGYADLEFGISGSSVRLRPPFEGKISCHSADFRAVTNFDALEQIESYDPTTLVVFDIDKVLFVLSEPTDREYRKERANARTIYSLWNPKSELYQELDLPTKERLWSIYLRSIQPVLLDPKIPDLVQKLQEREVKIIALTKFPVGKCGNIPSLEEYRVQQLAAKRLDFRKAFPETNSLTFPQFSLDDKHPQFLNGVLFTHMTACSKGELLKAFFKRINWTPDRVVAFDDKVDNLQSMQKELSALGVKFEGFEFTGATKLPAVFDQALAEFQFQYLLENEKWLPATEAREIQARLPSKHEALSEEIELNVAS